jgi:hypothetical protein
MAEEARLCGTEEFSVEKTVIQHAEKGRDIVLSRGTVRGLPTGTQGARGNLGSCTPRCAALSKLQRLEVEWQSLMRNESER